MKYKLANILGGSILLVITSGAEAVDVSCFVTGGGVLVDGDLFAISAMNMPDDSTRGSVTLHTPYGYRFQSNNIEVLRCTDDGGDLADPPEAPQLARFAGTGRWNKEDGFRVVVFTEDRGEPTEIDLAEIRVFDGDDNLVYIAAGFLISGNVQHLPANNAHN